MNRQDVAAMFPGRDPGGQKARAVRVGRTAPDTRFLGRSAGLLVLGALLLIAGVGCVPLKPWERAGLMTRVMQETADPLETGFDVHVHGTRESIQGAAGGGGASCGCN